MLVSSSTTTTETKRYKTKNSERTTDFSGKFLCFQRTTKTVICGSECQCYRRASALFSKIVVLSKMIVATSIEIPIERLKAELVCWLSVGKSNLTVLLAFSSQDFYLDKEEYNSELLRDLCGALLIYTI